MAISTGCRTCAGSAPGTLKPGRPSNRYLLRGIARCERCQGKMHGTSIGRKLVPRYYCATRRAEHTCDQPLVHTDVVEAQLVDFIADFKPAPGIRNEILRRLADTATTDTVDIVKRRASLEERLARARDLYELGDLARPELRRAAKQSTPSLPNSPPARSPTSTRPVRCSRTSRSSGPERQTPPPSASFSRSSSSAYGSTSSVSSPSNRSRPSPPTSNPSRRKRPFQGCVKSGSDGGRPPLCTPHRIAPVSRLFTGIIVPRRCGGWPGWSALSTSRGGPHPPCLIAEAGGAEARQASAHKRSAAK